MKVSTVVCSDKGGVGKSEIAALLVAGRDRLGGRPAVIEIDHQMKLKSVLGDRVNLSIRAGADLSATSRDRHAAQAHYDGIYDLWSAGETITDLGANVTTPFFEWVRNGDIASLTAEDGIRMRFAVVTSPDAQALRAAYTALEQAITCFPNSELFLVENDLAGVSGFKPYKNTVPMRQIEMLQGVVNLTRLSIPYCDSILAEYGRVRGLTPLDVVDRIEVIEKDTGLTRVERATQRRKLFQWLSDVQTSLTPLMLLEPRV